MPNIRVGRMPGRIDEITVADGATVNDALAEAGLNPDGFDVRVDGTDSALDAPVTEGQSVLLVRKVKGNMPQIRVGRMPGRIDEITVAEGATVNDALAEAGLNPDGFDVRVDGTDSALDAPVTEGQSVLLVRKVKGN